MVSLCRLAPSSTPRLFSSTAVACYSSRAASTLSPPPPASRPTSPSATRPLPSKLPGADSFEAQKYASSTRKSQIVHLLTKTDWHKSREPGEDEESVAGRLDGRTRRVPLQRHGHGLTSDTSFCVCQTTRLLSAALPELHHHLAFDPLSSRLHVRSL
jgi:hypothetical protein